MKKLELKNRYIVFSLFIFSFLLNFILLSRQPDNDGPAMTWGLKDGSFSFGDFKNYREQPNPYAHLFGHVIYSIFTVIFTNILKIEALWAGGIVSALFGALSLCLLYLIIISVNDDQFFAIICCLSLFLTTGYLYYSTSANYNLINSFFMLMFLYFFVQGLLKKDKVNSAIGGAFLGLSYYVYQFFSVLPVFLIIIVLIVIISQLFIHYKKEGYDRFVLSNEIKKELFVLAFSSILSFFIIGFLVAFLWNTPINLFFENMITGVSRYGPGTQQFQFKWQQFLDPVGQVLILWLGLNNFLSYFSGTVFVEPLLVYRSTRFGVINIFLGTVFLYLMSTAILLLILKFRRKEMYNFPALCIFVFTIGFFFASAWLDSSRKSYIFPIFLSFILLNCIFDSRSFQKFVVNSVKSNFPGVNKTFFKKRTYYILLISCTLLFSIPVLNLSYQLERRIPSSLELASNEILTLVNEDENLNMIARNEEFYLLSYFLNPIFSTIRLETITFSSLNQSLYDGHRFFIMEEAYNNPISNYLFDEKPSDWDFIIESFNFQQAVIINREYGIETYFIKDVTILEILLIS